MITPKHSDLAGLFAPPASSEPFRQGVIEAFNPATGENQVRVGGAVLEDLPILAGGDTINFAAGQVVVLLKYRSSYAILGRVVIPGNQALTATAVGFYADSDGATTFNITNTYATQGELIIPTPDWANSVLVTAVATATVSNTSGASDTVRHTVRINSADPGETFDQVPDTNYHALASSFFTVLGVGGSQPLLPETTVSARIRCNGATTWPAGGVASVLNVSAVFRAA